MDPITLASTATAILIPYITKIGENIANEAGKGLWDLILENFREKPAASATADDFAQKADNKKNQTAFGAQLTKALKEDPQFLNEVEKLVRRIQEMDPGTKTGTQIHIEGTRASENSSINMIVGTNNSISSNSQKTHPTRKGKKGTKRN